MPEGINKLTDVFGNSRDVPLTYQTRPGVDDRFVNDLTRDKHVILHGGSKQGKTCLRKKFLQDTECIVVQCTRDTSRASLYEMILKKAGVEYELTASKTIKGTNKVSVKIAAEGKIPFISKAGIEGEYEHSSDTERAKTTKSFEIDIEDPNDIARVLIEKQFKQYIVIEDFHYLDEEIQKQFSFDLKVFHETTKYVFIIIGVWIESNRLIVYNGDLTGRVTNINVDRWPDDSLRLVISNGEPLLNISFPEEVKDQIVHLSQDNVGLLQEICYRICEKYGKWQTQDTYQTIGTVEDVKNITRSIADDQSARYRTFLVKFSEGLSITELEMYKWILYGVINSTTTDLRNGLSPSKIFSLIKPHHPKKDTLQLNNLNQALERIQTVQGKHKLQPPILDFSNNELFVVDANFLVFLTTHRKEELLDIINLH